MMSCGGIVILKQGCSHTLQLTLPKPVNLMLQTQSAAQYKLAISGIGAKGKDATAWHWGVVNVTDVVNIVYDSLFVNTIAPIIFIDGTPFKWSKLGIVQNKKDQSGEEDQTPFLDFSGYIIGQGVIAGEIDFQYQTP